MRAFALLLLAACRPTAAQHDAKGGACESCHVAEAREHAGSLHRAAFTDSTYQQSLALEEPKQHAFCNGCHAPEGAAAGVGCRSCHGEAHTAKAIRSAGESCAKCHEFPFDDRRADLVQKTITEHAASEVPNVPCADCHMPAREKRHDHAFRAGHDLPFLREALGVKATRIGADRVRIVIRPGTGHDFPTGDMFRRAQLLVFGEDAQGTIVASAERTFGRRWGMTPDNSRIQLADTRIHRKYEEDIALDAPRPITRVRWEIRFQRVLSQRGDDNVTLVSNDVIAEGAL